MRVCECMYGRTNAEGCVLAGVPAYVPVRVRLVTLKCKQIRTQNCSTSYVLLSRQVSLVTFATYVLVFPGVALDASTAFVALSLINILNYPMALVPIGVTNIVQVSVNTTPWLLSPSVSPT